MSLGLKNAGTTDRAMIVMKEMLEDSADAMSTILAVESHKRIDHLKHLETVFDLLHHDQLKMNPLKFEFVVTSGKFLGSKIRHRGIEVDPTRIKAVIGLPL